MREKKGKKREEREKKTFSFEKIILRKYAVPFKVSKFVQTCKHSIKI